MAQIQNAINNLAMTAAGGMVAKEMKTQGETLKGQLAVSQEQLENTKKQLKSSKNEALEYKEQLDYSQEIQDKMVNRKPGEAIDTESLNYLETFGYSDEALALLNPVVNRDEKKGTSAVKMSQQQAKSKSQQNKERMRRYKIAKSKRRGV